MTRIVADILPVKNRRSSAVTDAAGTSWQVSMESAELRRAVVGRTHINDIRRYVLAGFAALAILACLVTAALVVARTKSEHQALRDRMSSTATMLSLAFDKEVAAVSYLLEGLATSPALL